MNTTQKRHPRNQLGASLVEYALLVALIAVVCIAAVTALTRPSDDFRPVPTTEQHTTTTRP